MGRGDLTDEQWAVLEPLLPKEMKAGRPPVWPRRRLIDGIRFRVRTGVPWRDVPVEYGPWGRVYDLFRRWQRNGIWHQILTRLQSLADARGAITWDLSVDSTVCRAHQHAAGARRKGDLQKEPPGGVFTEPDDHGLGRSHGRFTTKLHLAVEQGQKPMAIVITAGQRSDSPQFEPVLEKVRVPRLGPRPATCPPRSGPGGQGVRLPQEPRLSAPTRDPLHHPGQGPPGAQPPKARRPRRPATALRPGRLPRTSCGRVRDQPPQKAPGCRHPIRQTRRPLRSHRPCRRDRRMAVTDGAADAACSRPPDPR